MKLELKHIAPYLPYELKGYVEHTEELCTLHIRDGKNLLCSIDSFINGTYQMKPILRPLSDLTKEIELNGETVVPFEYFKNECEDEYFTDTDFEQYLIDSINPNVTNHHIRYLPFGLIQKLFEWHFDVFRLIEKELAIDINTFQYENKNK